MPAAAAAAAWCGSPLLLLPQLVRGHQLPFGGAGCGRGALAPPTRQPDPLCSLCSQSHALLQGYMLQYSPLRVRQGDLTDPLYFDFISYAQVRRGRRQVKHKTTIHDITKAWAWARRHAAPRLHAPRAHPMRA